MVKSSRIKITLFSIFLLSLVVRPTTWGKNISFQFVFFVLLMLGYGKNLAGSLSLTIFYFQKQLFYGAYVSRGVEQ